MYETEEKPERVLLVGAVISPNNRWDEASSLDELAQLSKTAGVEVVEKIIQIRGKVDPAYLIGKGKVLEIKDLCSRYDIDVVIFDADLSPAQGRNLENLIGKKIIDRTELIMEVFAQHASSKASKLQVELAQLNYRFPRLTGKGILLSRLGGGIGTRGPGEKKLEVDRRRINSRIAHLKKELKDIERTRNIQRKRRKNLFTVALVGYTNAGKSTIMNALTDASMKVSSGLFTTLDPRTRIMKMDGNRQFLLTDTVGFIKNLSHHLIASFHSTLEEAVEADLRLHIVDVSNSLYSEQINEANKVLEELGCLDKPTILIFNKIDRVVSNGLLHRLRSDYREGIFASAIEGTGVDEVKEKIIEYQASSITTPVP